MKVYCKEINNTECDYFTVGKHYLVTEVVNTSDITGFIRFILVSLLSDDGESRVLCVGGNSSHTDSKWYIVNESENHKEIQ